MGAGCGAGRRSCWAAVAVPPLLASMLWAMPVMVEAIGRVQRKARLARLQEVRDVYQLVVLEALVALKYVGVPSVEHEAELGSCGRHPCGTCGPRGLACHCRLGVAFWGIPLPATSRAISHGPPCRLSAGVARVCWLPP